MRFSSLPQRKPWRKAKLSIELYPGVGSKFRALVKQALMFCHDDIPPTLQTVYIDAVKGRFAPRDIVCCNWIEDGRALQVTWNSALPHLLECGIERITLALQSPYA